MFFKDGKFGVEGLTPMIRDIITGEPTGLSVQLSKNWHYLGIIIPPTTRTDIWRGRGCMPIPL